MALPAQQKAIVIQGPKDARLVSDRRIPKLRDEYILVKTAAVALNPTDWKHIDNLATPGAVSGCDFSGTVLEVGKGVRKPWKKGDQVFGFAHGAHTLELEDGSFAEYIVAKGDLQLRVPPHLSLEEAATLGVGIYTVGQGMFQSLRLPLPTAEERPDESFPIFINGGSTATGTIAIQFAKLAGLEVITTCSPRNTELVENVGADAVFDYRDFDAGPKIRAHTSNRLHHVFDCIGEGTSPQLCADALSSEPPADGTGLHYSALIDFGTFPRKDVNARRTLAYSITGEAYQNGPKAPVMPARREDFVFAEMFGRLASKLLDQGKIEVHPPSIRRGGLGGVLDGLRLMREGKVSGEKLVYRVADTP